MLEDELVIRVRRMYAAINAIEESDLSKFKPFVMVSNKGIGVYQDWRGGLSDEQLSNCACNLIDIVAHFGNHLKKWARGNNKDETRVDDVFHNSKDLRIITDLSNLEKHASPARKSYSGLSPRLGEINRVLQLTTGGGSAGGSSSVRVIMDMQGNIQKSTSGSGSANVVITCDILDENNNVIGNYNDVVLDAVKAWEDILKEYGLTLR